jgi:hypothetical protein
MIGVEVLGIGVLLAGTVDFESCKAGLGSLEIGGGGFGIVGLAGTLKIGLGILD